MRKGFTLLEILIVVVILSILAQLVITNVVGQGEKAKKKIACVQIKNLKDALDTFKMEEGSYPTTKEGLNALVENPDPLKYKSYPEGGFLGEKSIPKDPWGHEYVYINDEGKIDILSLSSDGKTGGSGNAADISIESCRR